MVGPPDQGGQTAPELHRMTRSERTLHLPTHSSFRLELTHGGPYGSGGCLHGIRAKLSALLRPLH